MPKKCAETENMFEKDEDFQEKNIRRKQDKKLSKHFDISINDEKLKIVNYFFKVENHGERKGNYIQLISKFNILIPEKTNVKILLVENETEIEIIGDWRSTVYGNGIYEVSYWINKSSGIEEQ